MIASWFTSLTRYDGWFLIPFLALWLALSSQAARPRLHRRCRRALPRAALLARSQLVGNRQPARFLQWPLLARSHSRGQPGIPAIMTGSPLPAITSPACWLCAGSMLLLVGAHRCLLRAINPQAAALAVSALNTALLYLEHPLLQTPDPRAAALALSYYNTRYGTAVIRFARSLQAQLSSHSASVARKFSVVIPLLAVAPWLIHPSRQNWICWKESEVNSVDRRAWTEAPLAFLKRITPGEGILSSAGDVTGIYCRARIHLSETINIGNGPLWLRPLDVPTCFTRTLGRSCKMVICSSVRWRKPPAQNHIRKS